MAISNLGQVISYHDKFIMLVLSYPRKMPGYRLDEAKTASLQILSNSLFNTQRFDAL